MAPSRIDVNSADTTTLMLLPGITAKAADDIQRERRRRLGFARLEELEEFLHLQPAEVEQLRPLTTFATGPT